MVPSWTVVITGAQTAYMDFSFVPGWFADKRQGGVGHLQPTDLESFIESFCTLVAHDETEAGGNLYKRRVEIHRMEEDVAMQKYNVFFSRQCLDRRTCTKIEPKDGHRYVLYAYKGGGLYRGRPDWRSMVIRSRSLDLTDRVCKMFYNARVDRAPFSGRKRDAPG